jgi:hypothetical protein
MSNISSAIIIEKLISAEHMAPSKLEDLSPGKNEFANYIACDTMEYRKRAPHEAITFRKYYRKH